MSFSEQALFREERIQDGVVLEASRVKVENYFIISIIS